MTIDEAIAKYNKLANNDRTCYPEEAQQLAEWLEELKVYKECNISKTNFINGYNKALDDFVKKISESNQGHWRVTRYEHGEAVSETMSYDIGTIKLIAEQLKAGEDNV